MTKKVPFYANTRDNTHCYQAALKSILGYFGPEKNYTWKELDKFTAKMKGKWTWPTQAMINFHKMGFDVKKKSTFDHEKFVKDGGKYLIEKYGKETGEAQIKNSDIKQEIRLAKEYVSIFGNEMKLSTLSELKKLIKEGYLLVINVNYYPLYNKKGYAGHFVVIFKMDDRYVQLHDPGLPPNPNAKIPLNNFIKAWEYPNKDSRNYQAFKLKSKRKLVGVKLKKVYKI